MRSGSPEKSTLSNRRRRVVEYTDNFGNLGQRVLIPKGAFEVRCSCRAHTADTVDVEPKARFVPVQELPESALQFLLPSRYCQSDLLNELASSIVGAILKVACATGIGLGKSWAHFLRRTAPISPGS
jgi:transglutaminase-like putative cysteine protease